MTNCHPTDCAENVRLMQEFRSRAWYAEAEVDFLLALIGEIRAIAEGMRSKLEGEQWEIENLMTIIGSAHPGEERKEG